MGSRQRPRSDENVQALSLSELLLRLTDNGIRFPPTATRAELEMLWEDHCQSRQQIHEHSTTVSSAPVTERQPRRPQSLSTKKRPRKRPKRVDKEGWNKEDRSWQDALQSAKQSAKQFFTDDDLILQQARRAAARQVRRVSRKASDFLNVDDDGVRDVDFTYLRKDESIRYDPTSNDRNKANDDKRRHRRAMSETLRTSDDGPSCRIRRKTRPREYPYNTAASKRVYPDDASQGTPRTVQISKEESFTNTSTATEGSPPPIVLLATANTTKDTIVVPPAGSSRETQSRTARPTTRKSKERKIYNPYTTYVKGFGSFVGDVAERVMWGQEDDEDSGSSHPSKHWKDRLEERFDYMLGIHEDGAYYNSWAGKAKADKRREGGRDAFSVARGVQPKRRGVSPTGRTKYTKPIWEEEGNLISLLFGRSKSGGGLLFEKILDRDNGSVLYLFKAVARSVLLVASYMCRWASVRGALPQPVVVVGVMTAGICVRRKRLRAIVLALILFRTFGELLHGYVYGSDGWEDDADESCYSSDKFDHPDDENVDDGPPNTPS